MRSDLQLRSLYSFVSQFSYERKLLKSIFENKTQLSYLPLSLSSQPVPPMYLPSDLGHLASFSLIVYVYVHVCLLYIYKFIVNGLLSLYNVIYNVTCMFIISELTT